MTHDFFVVVLFAAFDYCGARAEEVAIVEAAAGYAELVDAVAAVALPEPVEGFAGWGQEVGGCAEFGGAVDGGQVLGWWREWGYWETG